MPGTFVARPQQPKRKNTMFQAYHGVTGAQHQANFNNLSAQGYRMISLSVYGDPGNPLYAAVWVQRSGPAWEAVHGVDSAGYQSFFNTWTAKGYVPVLVSATGAINNAIFAAVFEQGITGPWFARHGMPSGHATNAGTFQNESAVAAAGKMILRSVAIYGSVASKPPLCEVARASRRHRSELPGGFQCRDAVAGISTSRLSPRLCGSFQRRNLLLRFQGRRGGPVGGAAWNDRCAIPDRIQPAGREWLLPDLYPGRRFHERTSLCRDLCQTGYPLEPRVDRYRHGSSRACGV